MDQTTFEILVALLPGPLDAGGIRDSMAAAQPQLPPLASFYRHLKRAMEANLLELSGESSSGNRGRPSQTFRITPVGRRNVRAEAQRLQRLADLALGGTGKRRG